MNACVFKHRTGVQVRISDLDPFAHVNNGSQCHLFDYGRSKYFEAAFKSKINWTTMDLVLVHIDMDFLLPVNTIQNIICETCIYEIGNKSMKMIQRLVDEDDATIKTISKCVIASIDREKNVSKPISEFCRKSIQDFEGDFPLI
ncbi:MAG: acyl-CoA thioesterase [Bacteroidales bacterium]|nr:acyl-CoA thioesterase [Bacteroidales bacterium]MDD2204557.1 acyl-CoA thioesterase [Bacteroidales bacterium]MDD3152805.1 acyl-CoA thioesterase [Bacteroidales bacterium]